MSAPVSLRFKNEYGRAAWSSYSGLGARVGQPYRVGCMSMSAAFAFGYDADFCASGCQKTKHSAYYHSSSTAPFTDFNFRPTMMLAATTVENAESFIMRGIKSMILNRVAMFIYCRPVIIDVPSARFFIHD